MSVSSDGVQDDSSDPFMRRTLREEIHVINDINFESLFGFAGGRRGAETEMFGFGHHRPTTYIYIYTYICIYIYPVSVWMRGASGVFLGIGVTRRQVASFTIWHGPWTWVLGVLGWRVGFCMNLRKCSENLATFPEN